MVIFFVFWNSQFYCSLKTPSLVLTFILDNSSHCIDTTLFKMESQSIDYPELDRIHKDHQIQLLAFPVQLVDLPQNHTMCIFLVLSFRKEFN